MKLYLMRHAEAADDAPNDYERPLTRRGIHRTRNAALVLTKLELEPDAIYASPRVRAQETAEILCEAFDVPLTIRDEVNFDFSVSGARLLASQHPDDADIIMVGHNPSMSEVLRQLTGVMISMKKGAVACIETRSNDLRGCVLGWYMPPRLFDLLALD